MPRRAATVTQADVARAIRAAKQEGWHVIRINAATGTIEVVDAPDIHRPSEADAKLEPLETI